MFVIPIIVFAVASSSDGFVVGFSYGIKKVRINFFSNFVISIMAGLSTFIIMLLGKSILPIIPVKYANLLGSGILILLGFYLLFAAVKEYLVSIDYKNKLSYTKTGLDGYKNILKTPEIIDTNNNKNIEFKESIVLGFILCLNNIGLGIGASISGLDIYITSICSIVFSFLFIPLGYTIGKKILTKNLTDYSEMFSALIIILLGLYQLIM
jgi:putative sporulation protein YtaF